MHLKQKKLFILREFTLKETSLKVKYKNLTNLEEYNIPYEEINTSKLIKQQKTDVLLLLCASAFGLLFLGSLFQNEEDNISFSIFLFIVSFLVGLMTYFKFKNVILIPTLNNNYLEIFNGNPSQKSSDDFVLALDRKINSYLKHKYGEVDIDLPIEQQLNNLIWLKEREILTNEEFNNRKSKLVRNKNEENSIGFK